MNNPLNNLPYNTARNYVMATAKGGCEIYIPVKNQDRLIEKRDQLQDFLNNQPEPPKSAA